MQEVITWIVIAGAVIVMTFNFIKSLKAFKKEDNCNGCGKSCEGCPVAPGEKIKDR
jgi:hypothetical protein